MRRATVIIAKGPDPDFQEPGGTDKAEGFSTCYLEGPFATGNPEDCAHAKANLFPNEGGPVVVEIEVPQDIADLADLVSEVRFEPGYGLEELLGIWPTIPKRILTL